ncbi:MAG: iron ABC transporter permease [Pseudomonadota bacterium]
MTATIAEQTSRRPKSMFWRRANDTWSDNEGGALAVAMIIVIAVLSVLPLSQLLISAARVLQPGGTEAWDLLTSPTIMRATGNTLSVALASTIFAMVVGVGVAIALACLPLRSGRALAWLFVLSLMIAPQVSALAFKTLAGPSSPILNNIGLAPPLGTQNPMLGFGGIVFVMGLHHAPLVAITIAVGLSRVPASLIEAAMLDGATSRTLITSIVLPVIRLHLLSAFLLCFVAGIGNFGIPALLGLPVGYITLPTLVFRELASFGQGGINNAAFVSLIIAAIAGTAVIASAWLMTRRDIRVDGGGTMEPFVPNGPRVVAIEILLWAFFALVVILPILSLLATSLVPAYGVTLNFETLTFAQFSEVLWRQALVRRAFANSLTYAGSAALILALLSLLIAYVLDRRLMRFRAAALTMIEVPYALPGVVVAIACILLFVRPLPVIGISLYGTGWIIVFAYLASFLAIAIKPVIAAVSSLDREVEEAALIDGAGIGARLRKVIGPLVMPSVIAGAVMAFLLAFNELTISALLWSAGTETLGVALLNLEDAGLGAEASALAVVATLVVAALMGILEAFSRFFPHNALPWRALSPT